MLHHDAVRAVRKKLGWQEAGEADEWDLFWSDQSISLARAVAMQPMQVGQAAPPSIAEHINCRNNFCLQQSLNTTPACVLILPSGEDFRTSSLNCVCCIGMTWTDAAVSIVLDRTQGLQSWEGVSVLLQIIAAIDHRMFLEPELFYKGLLFSAENQPLCGHAGAVSQEDPGSQHLSNGSTVSCAVPVLPSHICAARRSAIAAEGLQEQQEGCSQNPDTQA